MKVVIAIDSFKGCMSSIVAGEAAKRGLLSVADADVSVFPVADGGEGTTQVLTDGLNGSFVKVPVHGPLGDIIEAAYGILPDKKTAVMEMASASGITLIPDGKKDPFMANTLGVGEMIMDAVKKGCRDFIIGIGGSGTTEAGIGMLYALGYRFYDPEGHEVPPYLKYMDKISRIDGNKVPDELDKCNFHIACDVTNPLCGNNGAVFVYGKQKGVRTEQMAELDRLLSGFADLAEEYSGRCVKKMPGSGAAGGLGFAFSNFMKNAEMLPGIQVVCETIGVKAAMTDADFVITGEGKIDMQTRNGKVPYGVASIAKEMGCKVLAFAGKVDRGAPESLYPMIDECFAITPTDMPLEIALQEDVASENMKNTVAKVFSKII